MSGVRMLVGFAFGLGQPSVEASRDVDKICDSRSPLLGDGPGPSLY